MEGSLELLNHAIGHLELDSGFDNRIAMISVDVAVESMMKSYLFAPTSVRGTKHVSREEYQKITKTFHTLLDGLTSHVSNKKQYLEQISEIEWFHNTRNELYHSGIDITVDKSKVETYLEIAKSLFLNLFHVKIEDYIEIKPSTVIGEFFLTWRDIMPQLERLANIMELKYSVHDPRYMVIPRLLARKLIKKSLQDQLKEIRNFRNEMTHGRKMPSQTEIKTKITQLKKLLNSLKQVEDGIIDGSIKWKKNKPTSKGDPIQAKTRVTTKPGTKNPNDEIVEYDGKSITMTELGEIYALICKNEDTIYPKPKFKGSDIVAEFMSEVRKAGKVTDEIKKKYHLK